MYITLVDIFLLLFFAGYIYERSYLNVQASLYHLIMAVFSFSGAVLLYPILSPLLSTQLSLAKQTSDGLLFFLSASLLWTILFFIKRILFRKPYETRASSRWQRLLSAALACVSFFFLLTTVAYILLSLPVSALFKRHFLDSLIGKSVMLQGQLFEMGTQGVLSRPADKGFLFQLSTDIPIPLYFAATRLDSDESAEQQVYESISRIRQSHGRGFLTLSDDLTLVARAIGKDIFSDQQLSTISPQGYTLFDRLELAGISYNYAAENIALSFDPEVVVERFMFNSQTQENLLSPLVQQCGVGVVDSGVYGKVFVIIFTN